MSELLTNLRQTFLTAEGPGSCSAKHVLKTFGFPESILSLLRKSLHVCSVFGCMESRRVYLSSDVEIRQMYRCAMHTAYIG